MIRLTKQTTDSFDRFVQAATQQLGKAGVGTVLMHSGFEMMRQGLLTSDEALFQKGWNRLRSGDDYLCISIGADNSNVLTAYLRDIDLSPAEKPSRRKHKNADNGGMTI